MSKNKFRQVTNELYEILKDEVPEISNWKQEVLGPAYPKELTGFICCDTVEYAPFSKGMREATAVYTIEIICPNPKGHEQDTAPVEDLAMKVKGVLANNETLDGWAKSSFVNKIVFGTPAGQSSSIGIAVFSFTVTFLE